MKLEAFGATWILGPKGCEKTTTAKQKAKSFIEFRDEDERENYLLIANTHPSDLLKGPKPRLFDEWQDAPRIWGAIRKDVDESGETGQYILTGSSSKNVDTPHTGTLRISRMKMYPMSLYESRESSGEVSLGELFDFPDSFQGCHSDLTVDAIKFAVCRGGWPASLSRKTGRAQLAIAKDLYNQTCDADISALDNVQRNPLWARMILKSYARNICTLAETKTILSDVNATCDMSRQTLFDYLSSLERLLIVEGVDAWSPSIRSKTAIRSSKKKNLVDPPIAAASLGVSPEYFSGDYRTLCFLFESLCIRDLKIYSSLHGGMVPYYHDRTGLEADAVLHLEDGRYALIEFKLGQSEIDKGAYNLLKIENLIRKHNEDECKSKIRMPDLKLIVTGTRYGYRRSDGVFVIPIGCLKD